MRVSTIQRQLGHSHFFGDPGEIERPTKWTADWVRHRLVEAFVIERRIPDKRVGPAMVRNTWRLDTVDTFAEVVDQGEQARAHVWEQWARAGGALPYEISRMEEALSWPGLVLSNGHAVEGRILLAWGLCVVYGRPVRALLRKRGWSRTTFYRSVDSGAQRIAVYLNAHGVAVR